MAGNARAVLRELELSLDKLSQQGIRDVSKAVTADATALSRLTFRAQTSPQGDPWAPLKKSRKRGSKNKAQILVDTGALRASVAPSDNGNGYLIRADRPYAVFHQFGTKKMVARPFLPTADNFPATWEKSHREAAEEAIEALLK